MNTNSDNMHEHHKKRITPEADRDKAKHGELHNLKEEVKELEHKQKQLEKDQEIMKQIFRHLKQKFEEFRKELEVKHAVGIKKKA